MAVSEGSGSSLPCFAEGAARRGRTLWDHETARVGRDYRIAHCGDPSGVLVLDATGCLKKDN